MAGWGPGTLKGAFSTLVMEVVEAAEGWREIANWALNLNLQTESVIKIITKPYRKAWSEN